MLRNFVITMLLAITEQSQVLIAADDEFAPSTSG
jgi:hypothetical protein